MGVRSFCKTSQLFDLFFSILSSYQNFCLSNTWQLQVWRKHVVYVMFWWSLWMTFLFFQSTREDGCWFRTKQLPRTPHLFRIAEAATLLSNNLECATQFMIKWWFFFVFTNFLRIFWMLYLDIEKTKRTRGVTSQPRCRWNDKHNTRISFFRLDFFASSISQLVPRIAWINETKIEVATSVVHGRPHDSRKKP